jgi:hypothetical protein
MASKFFSLPRPQYPLLAFFVGIFCVVMASGILAAHARLFSQKRDTAVMIGTSLPEMKSSVALLEASVNAEQLFATQALAAREEQASAYILPLQSPVSRTVSAIQELVIALQHDRNITLQKLMFDPKVLDLGSHKETKGTMILNGSFDTVASLLTVLGYGGDMMIRDVLSVHDQQRFLEQVEKTAPLSLKRAEDFLYLDLVQYASMPDNEEQNILSDVSPDAVDTLRSFLLQAGLASVRSELPPVASHLQERTLWPLPLLRIMHLTRSGDIWTVDFIAYSR